MSATGNITLNDNAEIEGNVHENYTGEYPPPPEYPELPVEFSIISLTWEIMRQ